MSYKHVGTAFDLVRFGCSLKVGIEDDRRTVHQLRLGQDNGRDRRRTDLVVTVTVY
ncbi:hypothetical protein [Sphingomonas segetis]|jgi:hypothetical protein|uniref:hypothetical protein n=1 Tax=Sphingomonas segetis TaxID=1104779 RepID=UPI0012D2FE1D|nr:hypothetical protein [Sphingomonas segetis]